MEEKLVYVGIFWAVPKKENVSWVFYEVKKLYPTSSANALGFIDYPYSHYEKWEDVCSGSETHDCYHYPRGRVLYDTNTGKHRIFADECLDEFALQEIVEIFEIEDFELCHDEHYVSAFTKKHNTTKSVAPTLSYNILRGKDKIGENLIEISYGSTKILLELGRSLDGHDFAFEHEVLQKMYTAVVISHYHEDHAGLIAEKKDCPIYIGSGAKRIISARCEFLGGDFPENLKTYRNARPFKIGGIKITPYLCDHSAFDSYMLLFEAGGKSILYTGDFRFHGRKDKKKLLSALPKSVDALIHEGTNLGKNSCTITESELEEKAVEIMKFTDGPLFVLQSGSNIDRLVSIYRASKRSGRIMYMDNYVSLIAAAVGGRVPRPDVFDDVVAFTPYRICGKRKDLFLEIKNKKGSDAIANGTKRFTMLCRPTMLTFLKKMISTAHISGATLIYSMWKGYKELDYMSEFLNEMQAIGINIIDLHTSGHASAEDIELLKQTVNAKQVVCVHTEIQLDGTYIGVN